MNRRGFIFTLLTAIGLRKLISPDFPLGTIYPSRPFGAFQIDESYHTTWRNNYVNGRIQAPITHWPPYEISQEVLDDDYKVQAYNLGWSFQEEALKNDAFGSWRS